MYVAFIYVYNRMNECVFADLFGFWFLGLWRGKYVMVFGSGFGIRFSSIEFFIVLICKAIWIFVFCFCDDRWLRGKD